MMYELKDEDGTVVAKLPDNLTVRWSLNLSNTKITKLPDNLTVRESLDLSNTKIVKDEVPKHLQNKCIW